MAINLSPDHEAIDVEVLEQAFPEQFKSEPQAVASDHDRYAYLEALSSQDPPTDAGYADYERNFKPSEKSVANDQPAGDTQPVEPEETQDTADQRSGRFTVHSFAEIQPRTSTWLLQGVLPDDDLVVLVGEEGIGKGLYAVDVIGRVTRAGHTVLIIAPRTTSNAS